jgi:hypothetical protein
VTAGWKKFVWVVVDGLPYERASPMWNPNVMGGEMVEQTAVLRIGTSLYLCTEV